MAGVDVLLLMCARVIKCINKQQKKSQKWKEESVVTDIGELCVCMTNLINNKNKKKSSKTSVNRWSPLWMKSSVWAINTICADYSEPNPLTKYQTINRWVLFSKYPLTFSDLWPRLRTNYSIIGWDTNNSTYFIDNWQRTIYLWHPSTHTWAHVRFR